MPMRSSLFAYKTLISGIKRDGIAYGFDTLVSDGIFRPEMLYSGDFSNWGLIFCAVKILALFKRPIKAGLSGGGNSHHKKSECNKYFHLPA
jgi:hypothetical protein